MQPHWLSGIRGPWEQRSVCILTLQFQSMLAPMGIHRPLLAPLLHGKVLWLEQRVLAYLTLLFPGSLLFGAFCPANSSVHFPDDQVCKQLFHWVHAQPLPIRLHACTHSPFFRRRPHLHVPTAARGYRNVHLKVFCSQLAVFQTMLNGLKAAMLVSSVICWKNTPTTIEKLDGFGRLVYCSM